MVAPPSGGGNWMYLHPRCHPSSGTWLRLGPDGAHVVECCECRKIVTAFRIMPHPTEPGKRAAENITHEPGLTYEEMWADAPEELREIMTHPSPDVGGICGEMRDRGGRRIVDDLEDWADAATICRRDHGHKGGCHFESV